MSPAHLLARAALENARWCDLVCRAHGVPGELHEAYWIDRNPVPPYYPRLVTLGGPERAAEHVGAVRELLAPSSGRAFAIKDSFRALDLVPLGFRLLLEAEWFLWPAERAAPDTAAVTWTVVDGEERLAAWEAAWRGPTPAAPGDERMFPADLLRVPDLVFFACERATGIVATGVLHRSDDVVGLSNVTGDAAAALRVGVSAARQRFPGSPVVGYERGPELDAAVDAGFARLGPLAVWESPEPVRGATASSVPPRAAPRR